MQRLLRTIDGETIALIPISSLSETSRPAESTNLLLSVSAVVVSTLSSTLLQIESASNFLSPISPTTLYTSALLNSLPSVSASVSVSLVSRSISTAFSIEPKSSSLNSKSNISTKKIRLIIGLTLGTSFFLFLLVVLLFCFFKQRSISIDVKPWKNNAMDMHFENKNDEPMIKKFNATQTIRTPLRAYTNFVSREKSSYWKVPIITSSKNSTIQNNPTSKKIGPLSKDSDWEIVLKGLHGKECNNRFFTNEDFNVDTFLYTNPPNIKKINTDISLSITDSRLSDAHPKKKKMIPKPLDLGSKTNDTISQSKWTYLSPLSKWFLRSSTYLQDSEPTTPVEQTLSVDLKTLQLLSEKRKQNKLTERSYKPKVKIRNHLIDINTKSISMFQKPLPELPKKAWDKSPVSKSDSTTSSGITDSLYIVIKDYEPQLLDEIEIHKGQCVKLLAVHSDKWVLITNNLKEMKYMDDSGCKGIVPMVCLKKLQ